MNCETNQTSCCCERVCIVVKPSEKGCDIQVRICDDEKAETSKVKTGQNEDRAKGDCCC